MKSSISLLVTALVSGFANAQFFLPDFPYMDPPEGAQRSPCPFINVLANHGYINRDGQAVDIFDLADTMSEVFDLSNAVTTSIAQAVVDRGLTFTDAALGEGELLNIDDLFLHGFIEHDASYARVDDFFGDAASKPPSVKLIDELLAIPDADSPVVTKKDLMEHQFNRIIDGRKNNPDFDISGQEGGLAGQSVFMLLLGSQDDLAFVTKSRLETLLKEERIPDDYVPGAIRDPSFEPIDFSEGSVGFNVRSEFSANVQGALAAELEEDDEHEQFFLPDFPYMPPSAGAQRSPCPFINVLANHGYINRDGLAVEIFDLANTMTDIFDLSNAVTTSIAQAVVDRGLTFNDAAVGEGELLNIDDLFLHGFIEHDASYARVDDFFGDAVSKPPSIKLIDELLAIPDANSPVVTKKDLMEHQFNRIIDGRMNNPEFDITGQEGGLAGQSVFMLLLGSQADLSFVTKSRLETLLKEERIPDDYVPGQLRDPAFKPIDFSEGSVGFNVRSEFSANVQSALAAELDDDDIVCEATGFFRFFCFIIQFFYSLFGI